MQVLQIHHCRNAALCKAHTDRRVEFCSSQVDLPYTFKTLAGGMFSQQTNFGCISLNEFSILSVLKKMFVVDSYYCASFYYTGSKFNYNFWNIHFVVTTNLDACTTVSGWCNLSTLSAPSVDTNAITHVSNLHAGYMQASKGCNTWR